MPVMSYLVYPVAGRRDELASTFEGMESCEILPSENTDLLLLLTDTPDAPAQKRLEEELRSLDSIATLALVSGFDDSHVTTDERS